MRGISPKNSEPRRTANKQGGALIFGDALNGPEKSEVPESGVGPAKFVRCRKHAGVEYLPDLGWESQFVAGRLSRLLQRWTEGPELNGN